MTNKSSQISRRRKIRLGLLALANESRAGVREIAADHEKGSMRRRVPAYQGRGSHDDPNVH